MFVLGMDPGMLSIEFREESYVTGFDEIEEAFFTGTFYQKVVGGCRNGFK